MPTLAKIQTHTPTDRQRGKDFHYTLTSRQAWQALLPVLRTLERGPRPAIVWGQREHSPGGEGGARDVRPENCVQEGEPVVFATAGFNRVTVYEASKENEVSCICVCCIFCICRYDCYSATLTLTLRKTSTPVPGAMTRTRGNLSWLLGGPGTH